MGTDNNTARGDSVANGGDLDSLVTGRHSLGTIGVHPRRPGPNAAPGPTGPAGDVLALPLLLEPAVEPESELGLEPLPELELTAGLTSCVGAVRSVEGWGVVCLIDWAEAELR